jgi:Rrf2 family nitric oxide-sensitive transcriptional repressor
MKLTRYTDYALRTLIYLGLRPDALGSIGEIATRYGISENHLMKVVQQLGRAGYLTTLRGRGGGIKLGRTPDSIRIGDVVRLTEEDFDIAECGGCVISGACGLTPVFARATAAFLAVLDEYTLADLIQSGDAVRALMRLGIRPHKPRRALRSAAA